MAANNATITPLYRVVVGNLELRGSCGDVDCYQSEES